MTSNVMPARCGRCGKPAVTRGLPANRMPPFCRDCAEGAGR